MKNKRLPRKLKKERKTKFDRFKRNLPEFVKLTFARAFDLANYQMALKLKVIPERNEVKFPVGGWVMQHNISQDIDEPVIRDSFKNHSVLPVIERLKQSSLTNDDLKRTTELMRGCVALVQPNVVRVNKLNDF